MSKTVEKPPLNFDFWQIAEEDSNYPFQTANMAFDEINPSQTLREYYFQDISIKGLYSTFVFGQRYALTPRIFGILRYRDATEQDLFEEVSKVINNSVSLGRIEHIIAKDKPRIVYLSRIGIVFDMQRRGIGFLLKDFFEFLVKCEQRPTIIYVKVLEQSEKMLGNQYQKVGNGFSGSWGNYSLFIRYLFLV